MAPSTRGSDMSPFVDQMTRQAIVRVVAKVTDIGKMPLGRSGKGLVAEMRALATYLFDGRVGRTRCWDLVT